MDQLIVAQWQEPGKQGQGFTIYGLSREGQVYKLWPGRGWVTQPMNVVDTPAGRDREANARHT